MLNLDDLLAQVRERGWGFETVLGHEDDPNYDYYHISTPYITYILDKPIKDLAILHRILINPNILAWDWPPQ